MRKQLQGLTFNEPFMQNHFELFKLPVQFSIDRQALDKTYKDIQNLVHPDRFVTATEAEKRTAIQLAAMANDAYHILRNPIKRAAYLCELNGYNLNAETHVSMDPEFLIQQIEWRESLENAREEKDIVRLEKLDDEQRALRDEQMEILQKHLGDKQFDKAAQDIRKMMFLEKFNDEISLAFDELDSTD